MPILVALLIIVPTIEIGIIVALGKSLGLWPTLGLLLFESALGAWLVRREGGRAWSALVTALNTGRMPSRQLADAALVLVGGTLLLAPGFLTDIVGFAFILPFTRPLTRGLLERVVAQRLLGGVFEAPAGTAGAGSPPWARGSGASSPASGTVLEGEVIDRGEDRP
ncbi:MAG: FxsA family protein [Micrococcales bacterium]|nr:FxsA family protein [Micrococcales bacterium]